MPNFSSTEISRVLRRFVAAALVFLAAPLQARADSRHCTVKIHHVAVVGWGDVYVNSDLGWWIMCSLNTDFAVSYLPGSGNPSTVSPAVCQSWLAMFTSAKLSQYNFGFAQDYGPGQVAPACTHNSSGNWVVPNPFPYFVVFGG
jgi:hypothetical protein